MVGVTQLQGALGHAMKAHHQLLGLTVQVPVGAHPGGQRGDVAVVVVVVVDEAKFGQAPDFGGPGVDRVKQAGGGGGAVLGVGRHDEHARDALVFEDLELRGDGRVAVAHGVACGHVVAARLQGLAEQLGLLVGPDFQG